MTKLNILEINGFHRTASNNLIIISEWHSKRSQAKIVISFTLAHHRANVTKANTVNVVTGVLQ